MIQYLIVFLTVVILYVILIKPYNYWRDRGVPTDKTWPIFGSAGKFLLQFQSAVEWSEEVYHSHDTRYVGLYSTVLPSLMIRDIELIKQISTKDFDYFTDHRSMVNEDIDPLFGRNLFSLKGQTWRDMRATLSPAFTGSKMRSMVHLITECAEQFVNHFVNKCQNQEVLPVEVKQYITRFANDVIATTAFGLKIDSLEDEDNEFFKYGTLITTFKGLRNLKFIGHMILPKVMKFLNVKVFGTTESEFFKNIILETMRVREEKGIVRPDMIQLLMQAKKGTLKHDDKTNEDAGFATVEESNIGKSERSHKKDWSEDDIVAQALLFFIAGFETTSLAVSFATHELAVNPDIQAKLIAEIDEVDRKCNGKVTYDALVQMKYMDMVISESLRKWPPVPMLDRVCNAPYTIHPVNKNEKSITLEKNDLVWFPVYPIHRDPKYYENPDRFDPERFSDENKSKINPYTYLPFGVGPRNCVGSRFALLEAKILIFNILRSFELVPTKDTQIPLRISRKQMNVTAEKGFNLGLKLRIK